MFKKMNKPATQDTPTCDINFVPSILPSWTNTCLRNIEDKQDEPANFRNGNVVDYTNLTSFVGWKGRVDYALNHLEQDNDLDENFLLCLLENAISAVILTASGQTVPNDFIISTTLFLKHIRDDSGDLPPNVALFLEYLKSECSVEVLSILDTQDDSKRTSKK